MKRLMSVCAAAVCAAVAFAVPKAEWLPADVDMTMAALCEQEENPVVHWASKEALKAAAEVLKIFFNLLKDGLERPHARTVRRTSRERSESLASRHCRLSSAICHLSSVISLCAILRAQEPPIKGEKR